MSDEPKQEGTTESQQQSQTPEVKKEEAPTSEAQASSPVEDKSAVQSSEEEKPKKSPNTNPKRKNSKPRSRSNSLNRGATAKEWKPKGDAKVTSTINANAPPFVSQHHQQQANAAREAAQQEQQEGASDSQIPQHHLQTPWTFWYSRKNKKGKGHGGAAPAAGEQAEAAKEPKEGSEGEKDREKEKDKEKEAKPAKGKKKNGQQMENPHRDVLTPLATVHSVEEFWTNYCYLQKPSALPKESNYYFFRNKQVPMWETFPKGGCYIVRVKKQSGKLDQMWEELLFASVGELFEEPNVVGVVVSIRSKEDALSVWTRTSQKNPRTKVSEKLKEVLELDKNTLVGYKSNASSMRDKSTYKNAKKIILAS